MKKWTKRLMAALLVLCMCVPFTAMAATNTYYLEVSIEEQDNSAKIVKSESAGYLLDSELLVPLVVQAVNERYNDGSLERVFQSPAMRDIMLEGLRAYKKSDAAWVQYWNKYYDKVSNLDEDLLLKEMLTDMDDPATIGELDVDVAYQIKFKNDVVGDRKYGVTYIVTVTRRAYSASAGATLADPAVTGVADMLNTDEHIAFMQGDDAGNFRPDKNITRAEVAQMFYNLLRNKNVETTKAFTDVKAGIWYEEAVNVLATLGILKGAGDGTAYEPERSITRAEFATIAARFAKAAQGGTTFVDVAESHWAYEHIATAAAYGWVTGTGDGTTFEPDRPIQRVEAATIVNRMLGRLGDKTAIDAGEGRQFPDVTKAHWGWYQINEATTTHDYAFTADRSVETWNP